jgi:peptidoglycan-associated lipoprotein
MEVAMRVHKLGRLVVFLVSATLILGLFASCSKKEPAESTPMASSTPAPSVEKPGPWTPEKSTPSLEVQNSADAFNKQGVLKSIHFETDKWDILPPDRAVLKENAAWLLAHPALAVIVEGNCDERNTEAYNLALGERRANAAKQYLIGLGVPASRIQTVSYGKNRPICEEHNEACWQQNRRDDFILQEQK